MRADRAGGTPSLRRGGWTIRDRMTDAGASSSAANEAGSRTPSSSWSRTTPHVSSPPPPLSAGGRSDYTYSEYTEETESDAGHADEEYDEHDERHRRPLARLSDWTHGLLKRADSAFVWLTEPSDTLTRVPAPPRPEQRTRRADHRARSLDWRELGELRAALSENVESQGQGLRTPPMSGTDVDAQAQAEKGEASLREKQALLRRLRDQIDAAPAAREERLRDLRGMVSQRADELEAAQRELAGLRAASTEAEKREWDEAEAAAASLAAEAAKEQEAADAADAGVLESHARLVERIARLEEALHL